MDIRPPAEKRGFRFQIMKLFWGWFIHIQAAQKQTWFPGESGLMISCILKDKMKEYSLW